MVERIIYSNTTSKIRIIAYYKKDKELLKLDKTAAKIKGVNIAPNNYNLLFLDTEKTIIDVVSFHDSD